MFRGAVVSTCGLSLLVFCPAQLLPHKHSGPHHQGVRWQGDTDLWARWWAWTHAEAAGPGQQVRRWLNQPWPRSSTAGMVPFSRALCRLGEFLLCQDSLEALLFLRWWWIHRGWVGQAARPLHLGEEHWKPGEDPAWDQRGAPVGCRCNIKDWIINQHFIFYCIFETCTSVFSRSLLSGTLSVQ